MSEWPCLTFTASDSCQSRASFLESSTTVTSISTSFCGTSSCLMRFSDIGMRETASRTRTALRRFSARITGVNPASCRDSRTDTSFVLDTSWFFPSVFTCIISSRSRATPRIVSVDSGLFARKLTSSAHVYVSGNIRVSTSLNVRSSLSLSAFATISETSET